MPNIEDVIDVVKEAGAAALALQEGAIREAKKDGEAVSAADRASDLVLRRSLEKFGFPIFSEESQGEAGMPDTRWIIDPLDGTLPFLEGSSGWTVMVGFARDGLPILGVVYSPPLQKLWYSDGAGAYCELGSKKKSICVSSRTDPHGAIMVESIFHHEGDMDSVTRALGAIKTPMHGAGSKICAVVEGEADMTWSPGALGQWDLCAPHAILEAAGGILTDTFGKPIQYQGSSRTEGFAASNGKLHPALISAIQTIRAKG
ncbi:3'(2'),5'-bisphosphate nucleotidase CysQ [Candidatus Kaiserbacteria bacterium]|nr:3'(2'),5'-bisphosphate nucleotidase CysQ [Candidatus Kaiserbacteria bacterium]